MNRVTGMILCMEFPPTGHTESSHAEPKIKNITSRMNGKLDFTSLQIFHCTVMDIEASIASCVKSLHTNWIIHAPVTVHKHQCADFQRVLDAELFSCQEAEQVTFYHPYWTWTTALLMLLIKIFDPSFTHCPLEFESVVYWQCNSYYKIPDLRCTVGALIKPHKIAGGSFDLHAHSLK